MLSADASAYIFFTSGSTGAPKGVLGTHLGLAHFIEWQRSSFQIGCGDHTAQLTALSFDVVLRDILFPLTSGACIHIPRRETLQATRGFALHQFWIRICCCSVHFRKSERGAFYFLVSRCSGGKCAAIGYTYKVWL